MAELGMDAAALAYTAELDPATVRTFLAAETWPQKAKRQAIEDSLQLAAGSLEHAARGLLQEPAADDVDPVARAIEASGLSRGNKHKLIGTYYDMLDQQERGVG